MKKPPELSVDLILRAGKFSNMTPGRALIHRFCSDVEAGKQPSSDDMKAIAHALRGAGTGGNMSESMDEVGRRLGIAKRQGKQKSEQSQWFERASDVVHYMLETINDIDAGADPAAAEARTRKRYAENLGIGDRAMRNRINKHKDSAKLMLRALFGVEPPPTLWK